MQRLKQISKSTTLAVCILATGGGSLAEGAMIKATTGAHVAAGKMAIMPFENLASHQKAVQVILPCLSEALKRQGFSLIPQEDLRVLLRLHRIRSVGSIGKSAGNILYQEAGIGFLGVGSISIFEEGSIPELEVTFRILDAKSMKVLWAGNGSASGRDKVWLFGLGNVDDMEILAKNVIGKMLKTLPGCLPDNCAWEEVPGSSVAIIPFENLSSDVHAANIVANSMLVKLYAMNLDVLEPGLLEDLLARRKIVPRGEIDIETMREIQKEYGTEVIVTGAVDEFELGHGDERADHPSVDMSIKYLKSGSGTVVGLQGSQVSGRERETVFGTGREYSMGNLITRQIGTLLGTPTFTKISQPEGIRK